MRKAEPFPLEHGRACLMLLVATSTNGYKLPWILWMFYLESKKSRSCSFLLVTRPRPQVTDLEVYRQLWVWLTTP